VPISLSAFSIAFAKLFGLLGGTIQPVLPTI